MNTINIKGKEYVMVNERVMEFKRLHPEWAIINEVIFANADECLIVSKIVDETGRVRSTGHAYERADATVINKTSHVENCETSSVGRCLGFEGIGILQSIATADEVAHAIAQQEDTRPWLTEKQFNQAIQRMENGEDLYENLVKDFRMKRAYKDQLDAVKDLNQHLNRQS